jgi:hypothetical protein
MKKPLTLCLGCVVVLASCSSTAGTGAYVGGQFGHVIGSAIGGITGGFHGHEVGSLIGTVGGAVAGAAIGSAVDNAQQKQYEKVTAQRRQTVRPQEQQNRSHQDATDESGYDPQGRGDDRISFDPGDQASQGQYTLSNPRDVEPTEENVASVDGNDYRHAPLLLIRNARVIDANKDMVLTRNEECKISFEIMNNTDRPVFNVRPTLIELTGNKHVHISPNLHVESIAPNSGIRYTATVLAGKKLKDGSIVIRVGVAQGNREITSQMQEFTVRTSRR